MKKSVILLLVILLISACGQFSEKTDYSYKEIEKEIRDLESRFATIKQHDWQVSPDSFSFT